MKINLIKILILMIIILLLFGTIQVFAIMSINPEFYKPDPNIEDSSSFKIKMGKIIGIINVVGIVCSVVIVCIVGIRYMLGSIEEKAEYKKTAIAYFIGALFLFSATTIPNILYDIGTSIEEHEDATEGWRDDEQVFLK